ADLAAAVIAIRSRSRSGPAPRWSVARSFLVLPALAGGAPPCHRSERSGLRAGALGLGDLALDRPELGARQRLRLDEVEHQRLGLAVEHLADELAQPIAQH